MAIIINKLYHVVTYYDIVIHYANYCIYCECLATHASHPSTTGARLRLALATNPPVAPNNLTVPLPITSFPATFYSPLHAVRSLVIFYSLL